ncbi:MAG: DNA repair protein RecO [Alphaproteobacteria bacterium]|nr:DNA repair protein RecO [Alphaproteobacteria bacterium]
MQWSEEGFVLVARRHGESSAVVSLLTAGHGRHAGLVRGGSRQRGVIQPGNRVMATWRARLADHLGSFTLEGVSSGLGVILPDRGRLAALTAACAVAEAALPERHPYPRLFRAFERLLAVLASDRDWGEPFVRWEITLLDELGFGLDLGSCAVTGATEGLAYVSPNSGRAVSDGAADPYRDRLLPLPRFLVAEVAADAAAVGQGLRLTGSFLERHAFTPHGRKLPAARHRLLGMISMATTSPGVITVAERT